MVNKKQLYKIILKVDNIYLMLIDVLHYSYDHNIL